MFEGIENYNDLPAIVKSKDGKQVRKFSSVKVLLMVENQLFNGYTVDGDQVIVSAKDEFFDLTVGLS
tara:strand:- start:395 stop:595 length:201 start_codon:yes stop_codon:yes gene_type:complete